MSVLIAIPLLSLLAAPAMGAQCGDWLLAPPGESCDTHCGGTGATGLSGKMCDEGYMWDHRDEVASYLNMSTVMADLGFPCAVDGLGDNVAQTPYFRPSSSTCYWFDDGKTNAAGTNNFDCTTTPTTGTDRRLCFCYIENCVHLDVGDYPMQGCRWHPERKSTCS